MTTRADIVAVARRWIGTRWQHQASLRGVACDCIGLVVGVARECGIAEAAAFQGDPLCRGYGRAPDAVMLLGACDRYLDRITVADARAGDVLLLRFEREPQHFGLVSSTEPRRMIHAYAQARRVVEHGIDELWRSRVLRAYRFRGVT